MKTLTYLTFTILLLNLFSCQQDKMDSPSNNQIPEPYTSPVDVNAVQSRSSCAWTVVPAGSVDALAAAIANTCDDGVIYLKAGTHTENTMVVINKGVKIIGEAGAVLKVKSDLAHADPTTGSFELLPGLHILNAPGALIQDVAIKPLGTDGGTAILVENSHGSGIMRNQISGFEFSVVVEKSDRMTIMFNTIAGTSLWQTELDILALGITIINGTSAYISDNDVSNTFLGIWACDKWGTGERNFTHGNYIGTILCNVPPAYILPNGDVTGSETPATGWKMRNNKSNNNLNIGYLVIDSANNNLLENNEATGNAAYDMELTTDSHRFGFLTPAAFNNTVNVGAFPNIKIKNCGPNNTINGGVLVDNSTDPCN